MTILQSTFLLALFLAGAFAAYGVIALIVPGQVHRRLDALAHEGGDEPQVEARPGPITRWLARIGAATFAREPDKLTPLRLRFYRAGLRSTSVPPAFYGLKVVLAIALPLAVFFVAVGAYRMRELPVFELGLIVALFAGIGYFLPDGILGRLTAWRQRELFFALPDALDLMRVCVEAGLSLDAAIQRVGRDIAIDCPALADELRLVSVELRAGATRADALHNLALRVNLEDVDGLVSMLIQTDRFGTSIADALKVHSEALRRKRQFQAQERAAKLPVKLLFPLVFCIFPALLLVLLAPAAIHIYRVMLPTIAH